MKITMLFMFLFGWSCSDIFSATITSGTEITRFQPQQVLTTGDRIRPSYAWNNPEYQRRFLMVHIPVQREEFDHLVRVQERVLELVEQNNNVIINNENL